MLCGLQLPFFLCVWIKRKRDSKGNYIRYNVTEQLEYEFNQDTFFLTWLKVKNKYFAYTLIFFPFIEN